MKKYPKFQKINNKNCHCTKTVGDGKFLIAYLNSAWKVTLETINLSCTKIVFSSVIGLHPTFPTCRQTAWRSVPTFGIGIWTWIYLHYTRTLRQQIWFLYSLINLTFLWSLAYIVFAVNVLPPDLFWERIEHVVLIDFHYTISHTCELTRQKQRLRHFAYCMVFILVCVIKFLGKLFTFT